MQAGERLLVIGPWPLKRWLGEVAALEPAIRDKYHFVDADHLLAPRAGPARLSGTKRRVDDENGPLASAARDERSTQALLTVRRMLGVAGVITVPVKHCYKVRCLVWCMWRVRRLTLARPSFSATSRLEYAST